jgi:stage 0 sporulation regulatory protein
MCPEAEKLEYRINQMRKSLILIVEETGLNSIDTIWFSQMLDDLITSYQKLKMSTTQKIDPKSDIVRR